MLVLSRKLGEEIVIGDDIRITVLEIVGNKVRLGISAPKNVIVDRQEVHQKRLNDAVTLIDHPTIFVPQTADISPLIRIIHCVP